MTVPTPLPTYIYKILPPSTPPPTPLPSALTVSALDAGDNFIHMSTSRQILRTLTRFFSSASHVYILRVPYSRVSQFVKWEDTLGKSPDEADGSWDIDGKTGYFPHIHGNGLKLGKEEVESVGKWTRGSEGWSVEGWPFEEDRPKV